MKYLNIILIFLLIGIEVKSQNTYKALYNINFNKNDTAVKIDESKLDPNKLQALKKMRKRYEKSLSQADMVDFNLDFNKKNSIFYLPEQLEIEQGGLKVLKRLGRFSGEYYCSKENTIIQTNAFGQDFIMDIPKFEWDISSYSKKIGNYKCYRATTIKVLEGSNGVFKQNVIAWFTPEIPFNFGPKEYNGLPGLIIQLEEGNISYILKSIKSIKDVCIEKPSKGKKITQKEFDLLGKSMYEKLKKGY